MQVVIQWIGCGRDGLICERVFKEKRFEYHASKKDSAGEEWMVGVCEGECMNATPGVMNPWAKRNATVAGYHSYIKPLKGRNPSVAEPTT